MFERKLQIGHGEVALQMKILADDRTHRIVKIRIFPVQEKITNWSTRRIVLRVFFDLQQGFTLRTILLTFMCTADEVEEIFYGWKLDEGKMDGNQKNSSDFRHT